MKLGDLRVDIRDELPTWPPLLAARTTGTQSDAHAHHAMHVVLAENATLKVKAGADEIQCAGIITGPDVPHAIEAMGVSILLVFVDPESAAGVRLRSALREPIATITEPQRDALLQHADPSMIMSAAGQSWIADVMRTLDAGELPVHTLHPRVRELLHRLREEQSEASLEQLAASVGLSPSRLLHVFTESVGIPLRAYRLWLRLQRASGAMMSGASLSQAAHHAGFSDAAHMSRTFRRMLGMPPSVLLQQRSQFVQDPAE